MERNALVRCQLLELKMNRIGHANAPNFRDLKFTRLVTKLSTMTKQQEVEQRIPLPLEAQRQIGFCGIPFDQPELALTALLSHFFDWAPELRDFIKDENLSQKVAGDGGVFAVGIVEGQLLSAHFKRGGVSMRALNQPSFASMPRITNSRWSRASSAGKRCSP